MPMETTILFASTTLLSTAASQVEVGYENKYTIRIRSQLVQYNDVIS